MKTNETISYDAQARDFLNKTGAYIQMDFLKNGKHFEDDKDFRDIYKITIKRNSRSFSFDFGQSINESQYYKDSITGRTYTLNGGCRTGNFSINDINKYIKGGQRLTLIKGNAPSEYDVLSCLQNYEVGTFENFCDSFGYNVDSRKAEKIYKAVCEEYNNLCTLFSDAEIELLQEIQ